MAGIYGIDIGTGQQGINFSTASTQGIQFVVVKAGGSNVLPLYYSPYYHTEVDKAKAAGMAIGHYWHTGKGDATAQADYFTSILYQFDPNSQILALDNETQDSNGETWTDAKIATWINRVVANTGIDRKRIWLYMGAAAIRAQSTLAQTIATGCRLWVSVWGSDNGVRIEPDLGGKFPGWHVQQYWSKSTVGGVNPVDKNYSPYTVGDLFDVATPPPPPPPPSVDVGWGDDPAEFYDGTTSGTVPPNGSNGTQVAVLRDGAWQVFWSRGFDVPPPPPPKAGVGRFSGSSLLTVNGVTPPKPKPTAAFSYVQSTTSYAVSFTNTSSELGGSITGSVWDFGDGSATSTSANPVHTYPSSAATYTVKLVVTDGYNQTATASKAVTVTPITTTPTQPSGPGISQYQTLAGSTFNAKINGAPTTNSVSFASGIFEFSDFAVSSYYGAVYPGKGLLGSGSTYTTIRMKASTSTAAALVPTASGTTNPLYLLRSTNTTSGVKYDGFHLQGTTQGHLYNGLRVSSQVSPILSNMKVSAIPGNSAINPGETFHINLANCSSVTASKVVIDGAGIGASGFGANSCSGGKYTDCTVSGMKYCKAWAGWKHTGGATFTRFVANNNAFAFGFERCAGTFTLNNCTFGTATRADIHLASDLSTAQAKVVINDPILPTGKTQIKVLLSTSELGNPNLQTRSDIKVYVNGVDKSSTMLTFVTSA